MLQITRDACYKRTPCKGEVDLIQDIEKGIRLIKARHPSYIEIVEAELQHYKTLCAELIVKNNELKAELHKEQLSFHFK